MRFFISTILLSLFLSVSAFRPTDGGDFDFSPSDDEATHYPAMILVEDGEDVDEVIASLQEEGVTVLRHRGNIILSFIPVEKEQSLARKRTVGRIDRSTPRFNQPTMNEARLFNNANLINMGYNLPQAYTGKGVVVGICDTGFDARHVNFRTIDGSECRIRQVTHYTELKGRRDIYTTPEDIYNWETDTDRGWHATHVAGIAAGAFGAFTDSLYYSLAPDADIVFSGSQLSDVGLLAGVEDIIDYAKEVGKPAVINLSMGNYLGPHDGSSLFARYLDMCADDAIICLSAGNEGRAVQAKSMSYDFTEAKPQLRVLANDWGGTNYSGEVEMWSPDASPFAFTFYWHHDTSTAKNLDIYPSLMLSPEELEQKLIKEWSISLDSLRADYDVALDSLFNEGYVTVKYGISPLNGHYFVNLQFELQTDRCMPNVTWAEYWTGLRLDGTPGQHVDIFCSGGSILRQERGNPLPDNNINFSDLATGFRTISVGMMNIRAMSSTAAPGSGQALGDVNQSSSYGTLPDGRKMPITVAPGYYIISSISSASLRRNPDDLQYTDWNTVYNDSTYYWIGTDGTSMACPFVVGAIATWLQAYPELSSEEAQEIILATNQTSGYPNPDDPRHGRGWFNAYEGMKRVVELVGTLKAPSIEVADVTLRYLNGQLLVGNPSAAPLRVDIVTPSGILAETSTHSGSHINIPLSHLTPGLYLVRVTPPSGPSQTLKILL